jgi:hypothetical protein
VAQQGIRDKMDIHAVNKGIVCTKRATTFYRMHAKHGCPHKGFHDKIPPSSRIACSLRAFTLTKRSISAFRAQHQASLSNLLLARSTSMLCFPLSEGTLLGASSVCDIAVFSVVAPEMVGASETPDERA